MTSDLAPAIIMETASMRRSRAHRRSASANKHNAKSKAKQRRQYRRMAQKRPPKVVQQADKPWNTPHADSEMQLFICESVKETLRKLENEDYKER